MAEQNPQDISEEIKVTGEQLKQKVGELLKEGNVRKVTIKDKNGSVVFEGKTGAEGRLEATVTERSITPTGTTVLTPHTVSASADDKTVTESGDELAKAKGLKHLRTEHDHAVIELAPGRYEFQSSLAVVARR